MTRERRTFDTDSKLEVVRMIKEQGMSFAQVSQTMNIGQTGLRRWVAQYESELNGHGGWSGYARPEKSKYNKSQLTSVGFFYLTCLNRCRNTIFVAEYNGRGKPQYIFYELCKDNDIENLLSSKFLRDGFLTSFRNLVNNIREKNYGATTNRF